MRVKPMMHLLLLASALLMSVTSADTDHHGRVQFRGGDGTSLETAVLIVGAMNAHDAICYERIWIDRHYPRNIPAMQRLLSIKRHTYDEMIFGTPDGVTHSIYFDLTPYDWNHQK